jgi:hypothetical protein
MTYFPPLLQVTTSGDPMAKLILERTNLKSAAVVQLPSTAGKLTFSQIPLGKNGAAEPAIACVTIVESAAYLHGQFFHIR